MKYLKNIVVFAVGILMTSTISAQETLKSITSQVDFNATESVGKEIKAFNKTSKFALRTSDNSLVGLITIKDFIFPNSLMQEHFNENYMDSDTYPKASFSGKLLNFDLKQVLNVPRQYEAKGKIKIHGVEKDIILPVSIFKIKDGYQLDSEFEIKLKDFKIKIPKLVFVKIAEQVTVNLQIVLE